MVLPLKPNKTQEGATTERLVCGLVSTRFFQMRRSRCVGPPRLGANRL